LTDSIQVEDNLYSIPKRFRLAENMHIVFWLFKDMSWAMEFRLLGVAMFIPTFLLAIIISCQTRHIRSELFHNLAVLSWITANGFWMICEFYWPDQEYLRYYTAIPFSVGIMILAYYYGTLLFGKGKRQAI
jgi:hypothetical protein